MDDQVVNLDTISMAELKKLAQDEDLAAEAEVPAVVAADVVDIDNVDDRPRDAQGRFIKQAEEAEVVADAEEATGEPDRIIYRREIDLGGDAGIQVFQADTLEALVDKLAEAQRHATKKIREQAQELKKTAKAPEKVFTDADEYIYSQELQTKPTEAFKKLFKEVTGTDISTFKSQVERVDAWDSAQRSTAAQETFVTSHPLYVANPANGKRLAKWCQTQGYAEFTVEALEKAYQDLSQSGLLELKSDEAESDTSPQPEAKRIAQPKVEVVTQQISQRKASGISTRRASAPVVRTEPTEDELYSMPLNKLRELGIKASLANE